MTVCVGQRLTVQLAYAALLRELEADAGRQHGAVMTALLQRGGNLAQTGACTPAGGAADSIEPLIVGRSHGWWW